MLDHNTILSGMGIFKIKYNILDKLSLDKIDTFYIDLNTLLKPVYRYDNDDIGGISKNEKYSIPIASAIMNTVAHYRAYFVSKGWSVNIILYCAISKSLEETALWKSVHKALELCKIMSEYVPNVYMKVLDHDIIGSSEAVKFIKYVTDQYENNLIMTKNMNYYSILSDKVSILRPNRDASDIVTKDNVFNVITDEDDKYNISIELMPAILTISGNKDFKGIKGYGAKKTIKRFQSAINDKIIINEYYPDIDILLAELEFPTSHIIKKYYNSITPYSISKQTKAVYKLELKDMQVDKFTVSGFNKANHKFTGINTIQWNELLLKPNSAKKKKSKLDW